MLRVVAKLFEQLRLVGFENLQPFLGVLALLELRLLAFDLRPNLTQDGALT